MLYPAHYRAMFMTPATNTSVAQAESGTALSPGKASPADAAKSLPAPSDPYEFLHRAVFKAMAAGCFQPQYRDVAMITQVIWSGLHGAISLHLVRTRYAAVTWRPVQAGADMMVECLLRGLTTPNEFASR